MPYQDPPKTGITWQQAIVVLGLTAMLMTSVTLLALNNKDVGAVLSAVGGILLVVAGLFGYSLHNKVDRVETMANGRLTEQIEMNQKLQEKIQALALLVQPPPDLVPQPPPPPSLDTQQPMPTSGAPAA